MPTCPARRPALIVIARTLDDADDWRSVMDVGAEHIVELPRGAPWLYERLGRSLESEPAVDVVVVVGTAGGAGTSTLAAAMARHADEQLATGVLVDLDPSGGGVDLMLGCETTGGARWDELAGIGSRVDDQILLQALPRAAGVPVLSWSASSEIEPDVVAVGHVLDALARSGARVVIDVGRGSDPRCQAALARAARAVVLVPLRVRAVASAKRVLQRLPQHVEPFLVVREPAPGGLTAGDVEAALGVQVVATLASDRRRPVTEEIGGPAPHSSQWRRLCDALIRDPARAAA